jgi:hypothetical protein
VIGKIENEKIICDISAPAFFTKVSAYTEWIKNKNF